MSSLFFGKKASKVSRLKSVALILISYSFTIDTTFSMEDRKLLLKSNPFVAFLAPTPMINEIMKKLSIFGGLAVLFIAIVIGREEYKRIRNINCLIKKLNE
jgi:hypothetical protein